MIAIAAALIILAIGAVAFVFLDGGDKSKTSKRAKEVVQGKTPSAQRKDVVGAEAAAKRRANVQQGLKELLAQEQKRKKNLLSVGARLTQADLAIGEHTFWLISAGLGIAAAMATAVATDFSPLWSFAAFAVGGLGLPRFYVSRRIGNRQKKFLLQLSDGLDLVVRGMKSGLPLGQCLQIVATESPQPLQSEFRSLVDSIAMGVPMDASLARMYERMPLPEVSFFSTVLVIQQKTGGNLSEALGNLSAVLRARRMMREKIKALSAEAKASAWIIGSLPFGVGALVAFQSPDYINILFTTQPGQYVLIGSAMMMGMGVFVMRSMMNIKP